MRHRSSSFRQETATCSARKGVDASFSWSGRLRHCCSDFRAPQGFLQRSCGAFHMRLPQLLPYYASVFNVLLTTSVVASCSICLDTSHRPQRRCFPVAARLLEVDRSVNLNVLVVHNLPFLLLDAFVDGFTTVTRIRAVDEGAEFFCFFSSQRQLLCSFPYHRFWEVLGELGLYDLRQFLRFLQIANPDGFTVVNLDDLCCFAKSLNAMIKVSQTPCGGACARKTCASWRFVLSCMTKILFGAFQVYCPPHHQSHSFFPCREETHQV